MIDIPVIDFPQPDSPTSPTVSPGPIVERDAVDGLDRLGAQADLRLRSVTSSSVAACRSSLLEPDLERVL